MGQLGIPVFLDKAESDGNRGCRPIQLCQKNHPKQHKSLRGASEAEVESAQNETECPLVDSTSTSAQSAENSTPCYDYPVPPASASESIKAGRSQSHRIKNFLKGKVRSLADPSRYLEEFQDTKAKMSGGAAVKYREISYDGLVLKEVIGHKTISKRRPSFSCRFGAQQDVRIVDIRKMPMLKPQEPMIDYLRRLFLFDRRRYGTLLKAARKHNESPSSFGTRRLSLQQLDQVEKRVGKDKNKQVSNRTNQSTKLITEYIEGAIAGIKDLHEQAKEKAKASSKKEYFVKMQMTRGLSRNVHA